MELRIKSMSFPEAIEFNFEQLKQELTDKAEQYKGLVYTDDQVQDAKKDVAALRKFTKALSDERIKVKKECMKPYEEFETKIKELSAIVNEPIALIDTQLKEYEMQKKQEKLSAICTYWDECEHPEELTFESIYDEKWLNTSVSMKKVQNAITEAIQQFSRDMATLATLPEYSFEARQMYISTHDVTSALNEANRLSEMAKKKAEAKEKEEVKPVEEFVTPAATVDEEPEEAFIPSFEEVTKSSWINFKANMTKKQVEELCRFFDEKQIPYTLQ
jgi:hypothetical protein